MKKLAVAVASIFTAMAPAAFAQYYSYDRDYSESRAELRGDRFERRDLRDIERRDLRDGRRDFARVIEVKPQFESTVAKTECWNARTGTFEEVREENKHRIGKGAAIGAIAGGVLGHQIDQGGGTAAGALLGGLLGHHLEGRRDRGDQADLDMTRCRSFGDAGRDGYVVRYEYDGREYATTMSHDPGRRLRLGEDIRWDGAPFPDRYVHVDPPGYSGG